MQCWLFKLCHAVHAEPGCPYLQRSLLERLVVLHVWVCLPLSLQVAQPALDLQRTGRAKQAGHRESGKPVDTPAAGSRARQHCGQRRSGCPSHRRLVPQPPRLQQQHQQVPAGLLKIPVPSYVGGVQRPF